jgi:hypothetical protein
MRIIPARTQLSNSIGPRTPESKERSRRNALRHDLTAETVIVAIENEGGARAGASTGERPLKASLRNLHRESHF